VDTHQHQADCQYLGNQLRLTQFARLDYITFGGGDTAQAGDRKFAANDQNCHPARHHLYLYERNEGRGNQKFIGNGIEQRADCGDLPPTARQIAVEQVGNSRHQKDAERQKLVCDLHTIDMDRLGCLHKHSDQYRNEKDPQQRQCVGYVHRSL